jgi:CTP synthase (UTP-ammonia lyase)
MDKTLWAIRYARENDIPCFGTCGGFQHIIIEYARNVLGFKDAQHAEYDPYASKFFISKLDCSLAGREMTLNFVAESQVASIYGAVTAIEQYYCNFGVNPECIPLLISSGILSRSFCVRDSRVETSVTNPGMSSLVATQTCASASQND